MAVLAEQLKARIDEYNQALESIRHKKDALLKEEEATKRAQQGYMQAYEEEMRRAGSPIQHTNGSSAASRNQINRTAFIKDLIKNSGVNGMDYASIRKALVEASLTVHANYPYHVVSGMKERGEAEERDGRIYAK
jgi:hypothetical protein